MTKLTKALAAELVRIRRLERDARINAKRSANRRRTATQAYPGAWNGARARRQIRKWLVRLDNEFAAQLLSGGRISVSARATRDILYCLIQVRTWFATEAQFLDALRMLFYYVDDESWQRFAPKGSDFDHYRHAWRGCCATLYDAINPKPKRAPR